jgi:two-component system chemotaxis sensor kinase CheA
VQWHGSRIALAVDELIGDRELVVRPLPAELHDLPAYQGAAVQARGDLLLVLQPEFLVGEPVAAAEPIATARRALVVDDSLTARALHRTILESGGYQVHTAASARQALDHLRHAHYDVVIADVMMPDIDGVQMTEMLRERRETRDLPLVLVSAHDAQPERERGLAAGADAFVSKKDCISGRLLGEVAQAIARRREAR